MREIDRKRARGVDRVREREIEREREGETEGERESVRAALLRVLFSLMDYFFISLGQRMSFGVSW